MELFLSCIVGAGATYLIGLHSMMAMFSFFILFALFISAPLMLPMNFFHRGKGKIINVIRNIMNGWSQMKGKPGLFIIIALLILVNFVLLTAELLYCFKALSIDVSVLAVLVIVVMGNFTTVIRITPANLGIYEGFIAFGSHLLGIGFEEGLLAAGWYICW